MTSAPALTERVLPTRGHGPALETDGTAGLVSWHVSATRTTRQIANAG